MALQPVAPDTVASGPRRPRFASLTLAALLAVGVAACSSSTDPGVAACPDDAGVICTWAGTGTPGFDGDGHSLKESAFYWPVDMTWTSTGAYILDWNNHAVRQLQPDGTLQTVMGDGFVGDGPPDQGDFVAPGSPGLTVSLNHPTQLIELPDGKLLLAAWHNHKLRQYDPATGLVLITCGSDPGYGGDGGAATDALVNQPTQVALSDTGDLYILDQRNQRIRRIDAQGVITTVVGTGVAGFSGDGGSPLAAQLRLPAGSNPPCAGSVTLDAQGRLYISDSLNHRIRRVDFSADRIETVVGNGTAGFAGDGGPGTSASVNNPRDLEFGPDGKLYIADELNHRVRVWDPVTGVIETIAGNGTPAFAGDGGPAVSASLNRPAGLAFDTEGILYIVDTYNHRIRRVRL